MDTVTGAVTDAAALFDDARFVAESDRVKDKTAMAPGQRFTQQWQVRNTGSSTWGPGYRLVWVDRSLGAPPAVALPATPPDGVATLTIEHVTPPEAGLVRSTWRLCNPQDQFFGEELWTEIAVGAASAQPARLLQPDGRAVPAGAAPAGVPATLAPDPLTAAALGIIYTGYWLQLLQLPPGPAAEQAIARITAATVAQVQALGSVKTP